MNGAEITPVTVGNYRLQRRLGAGPSGVVYLAVHEESGAQRAVKAFDPDVLADPDVADASLQAVVSARKLRHPNIARIHELVEADGRIYVVRDYVEGVDLGRWLTQRAPQTASLEDALAIALQICAGLEHAHATKPYPVVHGALWPQNVLIGTDGMVRISDFGAWSLPLEVSTGSGASIRTRYCFRSPEHVAGNDLTRATDVFGVGVLLYTMLTGEPPFLGETLMQTVGLVERADLRTLRGVVPDLRDVVRLTLSREPRDRPPDAQKLRDMLMGVAPAGLIDHLDEDPDRTETESPDTQPVAPSKLLGPQTPTLDEDDPTNVNPERVAAALERLRAPQSAKPSPRAVPTETHTADSTYGVGETEADPNAPVDRFIGVDDDDEEEATTIDAPALSPLNDDAPTMPSVSVVTGSPGRDSSTHVPFEEEQATQISAPPRMEPPPALAPSPAIDPSAAVDADEQPTRPAGRITAAELAGASAAEIDAESDTGVTAVARGPKPSAAPPAVEQSVLWGDDEDDTTSTETPITAPTSGRLDEVPTEMPDAPGKATKMTLQGHSAPPLPLPPAASHKRGDAAAGKAARAEPFGGENSSVTTDPRNLIHDHEDLAEASMVGTTPWGRRDALKLGIAPPSEQLTKRPPGAGARPRPQPRRGALGPTGPMRPQPMSGLGAAPSVSGGQGGGLPTPRSVPSGPPPQPAARVEPDPPPLGPVPTGEADALAHMTFEPSLVTSDPSTHFTTDASHDPLAPIEPERGFFSKLTAAHVLLFVAIIVFLVAVGLLVRRLVRRSATKTGAMAGTVVSGSGSGSGSGAVESAGIGGSGSGSAGPSTVGLPQGSGSGSAAGTASAGGGTASAGTGTGKSAGRGSGSGSGTRKPPRRVRVDIATRPKSEIYIDGRKAGASPVRIEAEPGRKVLIAAVATGYKIYRAQRAVPARGSISIKLKRAKYPRYTRRRRGILRVRCKKKDKRRIYLDGVDTGYSCPTVGYYLRPGRYKVGWYDFIKGKITTTKRVRVRRRRRTDIRVRSRPRRRRRRRRR